MPSKRVVGKTTPSPEEKPENEDEFKTPPTRPPRVASPSPTPSSLSIQQLSEEAEKRGLALTDYMEQVSREWMEQNVEAHMQTLIKEGDDKKNEKKKDDSSESSSESSDSETVEDGSQSEDDGDEDCKTEKTEEENEDMEEEEEEEEDSEESEDEIEETMDAVMDDDVKEKEAEKAAAKAEKEAKEAKESQVQAALKAQVEQQPSEFSTATSASSKHVIQPNLGIFPEVYHVKSIKHPRKITNLDIEFQ